MLCADKRGRGGGGLLGVVDVSFDFDRPVIRLDIWRIRWRLVKGSFTDVFFWVVSFSDIMESVRKLIYVSLLGRKEPERGFVLFCFLNLKRRGWEDVFLGSLVFKCVFLSSCEFRGLFRE